MQIKTEHCNVQAGVNDSNNLSSQVGIDCVVKTILVQGPRLKHTKDISKFLTTFPPSRHTHTRTSLTIYKNQILIGIQYLAMRSFPCINHEDMR